MRRVGEEDSCSQQPGVTNASGPDDEVPRSTTRSLSAFSSLPSSGTAHTGHSGDGNGANGGRATERDGAPIAIRTRAEPSNCRRSTWYRFRVVHEHGMQILVSGSTGSIGRSRGTSPAERPRGDAAYPSRDHGCGRRNPMGPVGRRDRSAPTRGLDAVVHFAGESTNQRWTERAKQRIRNSRIRGTRPLADALADSNDPPEVLISASAVGYYGDCGDTWIEG